MWTPCITEHRRRRGIAAVLVACGVLVSSCGHDSSAEGGVGAAVTLSVTSTAFADGGSIPVGFTCDGAQTSPPLAWTGAATAPAAWALVVDDPDAPSGTFVHWVVLDIPPATRSVATGAVPAGATQGLNSAGAASYAGPCPPSGTHHYRFTVYALSAKTGLADGASIDDAMSKIKADADGQGTLIGTYARAS